jgi:hypothetical protein
MSPTSRLDRHRRVLHHRYLGHLWSIMASAGRKSMVVGDEMRRRRGDRDRHISACTRPPGSFRARGNVGLRRLARIR